MKKPYKIVSSASKSTPSSRDLADWLAKDGQLLLPLVALLEKGERAIDAVIDVMGRATIEAVLRMSAETVAGPKEQGRRDADRELYRHGVQGGRVALKDRQLRVEKPRPAQEAATGRGAWRGGDSGVHGVAGGGASGGPDAGVGAARRVGAGVRDGSSGDGGPGWGQQVGGLAGDDRVGDPCSSGAERTGPERSGRAGGPPGRDRVRGLPRSGGGGGGRRGPQARPGGARRGVGERGGDRGPAGGPGGAGSAGGPPASVRARRREGVAAGGRPGCSGLRTRCSAAGTTRCGTCRAIFRRSSTSRRVRRCGRRGSWRPTRGFGSWSSMRRGWNPQWPSAASSLREGLPELFTVNRLGLPRPLRRCLTTTNVIDSSHAGVRRRTNRVSRWRSEKMAVRWAAVTFRETEKHYRRITGYEHLWMLKAHLDDEQDGRALAETRKAGYTCSVAADFQLPAGHPHDLRPGLADVDVRMHAVPVPARRQPASRA